MAHHAPGAAWTAWLGLWTWAPAWLSLVTVLPLLIPDGHLPSARWRPLLLAAWTWIAAFTVTAAFLPRQGGGEPPNPLAVSGLGRVAQRGLPAMLGLLALLAVGCLLAVATRLFAAAVIALLVNPAYRLVRRGVGRLLYGTRGDPYAVLSALGRRLADTTDPRQVLEALAAAAAETVRSPYVVAETASGLLRVERGTPLAGLSFTAAAAERALAADPARAAELLSSVHQQASTAATTVRQISHQLRPAPLAELGLAGAIRQLTELSCGWRSPA